MSELDGIKKFITATKDAKCTVTIDAQVYVKDTEWLIRRMDKLEEALKHGIAAMKYAYEDRVDQYYLSVQAQLRESLKEDE